MMTSTTLYPHGHYSVGNEIIQNKISALIRAGQLGVDPIWHFHHDIFSKLSWQTPSSETLNAVYQRRAKQLREKYEYLVVSFSGGSDSWTVIKSFLDSGTHLDEVFVRWPIKATEGRYAVSNNPDPANILSEWHLTLKPMIKFFQDRMPHTKFTILDWSENFFTQELPDQDWELTQDFLNPGVFLKYNSIGQGELDALHSGKKTAIIFGADKPQLCVHQGNVYCYFLDKLAHVHASNHFERTSELFYWSHDVPEIVLVQAQAIYQQMLTNTTMSELVNWNLPYDQSRKNIWDNLVRSIIYSQYSSLGVFQAAKPSTNTYDQTDTWMQDNPTTRYMQSWKNGLANVLASVPDKYLETRNNTVTGFNGFVGPKYLLGPAPG
jgi:hypothetical protein